MLKTLGGRPLFAAVSGTWPPAVVALHGWGRDRTDLFAALHQVGDVASLDLPGFGMSPEPPDAEAWGTREYAAAVRDALADVVEPVVVVGHSFGGRVAVRLAADHPDLVRALVLTGAPVASVERSAARPALAYRLVRWAARRGLVPEATLERARRYYGSADYATASPTMRGVLSRTVAETYEDVLAAVSCPVTLVWGEEDREVPVAVAEAAAARLSQAELIRVPGVGHQLPVEHPEVLCAAVRSLLAS